MARILILAGAAMLLTGAAQLDPSNPGGAPTAPTKGTTNVPTQGQVIRNAAPGSELDQNQNDEPRPPSVLNGVEEPQRTGDTKAVKGELPSTARDPAPVETGPTVPPRR